MSYRKTQGTRQLKGKVLKMKKFEDFCTEHNRSGDSIKITALSWESGNPRLTDDLCIFKYVYGRYRSKLISTKQHQQ